MLPFGSFWKSKETKKIIFLDNWTLLTLVELHISNVQKRTMVSNERYYQYKAERFKQGQSRAGWCSLAPGCKPGQSSPGPGGWPAAGTAC